MVEKKPGFDVAARGLFEDLKENLHLRGLEGLRLLIRYDVAGLSESEYQATRRTIFSEPPVDTVYDEEAVFGPEETVFAVEYLPGQYDQRADSAGQCIQVITRREPPVVKTAQVIALRGKASPAELAAIKHYCINPVDSREASLAKPDALELVLERPPDVPVLRDFNGRDAAALEQLRCDLELAMQLEDLAFCQQYFRDTEKRCPTLAEIRVLDTYWSDHCRHTTFLTKLEDIRVEEGRYAAPVQAALREYEATRERVYGPARDTGVSSMSAAPPGPVRCLMDMALLAMKELRQQGKLADVEVSEEVNACSIRVQANVGGRAEDWLVLFKNETHNHPTEIEPFGGAATCLGGAIRDPLSGRAYVYQAMRVTGSGDPRRPVEETLPGKLPQRKITVEAAHGYSSYGNQIGLATGIVAELYDEGYVAKRMEVGAVIGAAPASNVVRGTPAAGDVVLLLGGRTGRDGCGGATGSSKEHTEQSIHQCSAEVQKGNPPTERKLQRLFREPAASRLIKKCNDFGAGGVSVAIGELAPGLDIKLDAVPKKYEGLDGTELAISESQERMAVLLARENVERFIELARRENLEATPVATVTAERRLRMTWRGQTIVNLARDFVDTNGVRKKASALIAAPSAAGDFFRSLPPAAADHGRDLRAAWLGNLADLNVCSQRGLVERFDSTIGAGSVLLPFGGHTQTSPAECMVAKLPALRGDTTTGTAMSHGFTPALACWSPFHGAVYAIVEALARLVAVGGDHRTARLSLQEYFEKLGADPRKWGKPAAALLGAFYAQKRLGIPAIGGKDSMSGSFKDMAVPPALVAFAVTTVDIERVIASAFTQAGNHIVLVPLKRDACEVPDFEALGAAYDAVHQAIRRGQVLSAGVVRTGGVAATVTRMCFGNQIGALLARGSGAGALPANAGREAQDRSAWFTPELGSLVLEIEGKLDPARVLPGVPFELLGQTLPEPAVRLDRLEIPLAEAFSAWSCPLEKVFPAHGTVWPVATIPPAYARERPARPAVKLARPRVLITVFPGTNCEYDTARAFERAGAEPEVFVMRNLAPRDVDESVAALARQIAGAQMLVIPGGFSAGDEPDGSGKFMAAVFRNERVKDAVRDLLARRDGLVLGICNGFQALIKLGLVPYGEVRDMEPDSPTLTFNTIGRHISRMVRTKIHSSLSPWFALSRLNDVHIMPISHGEGRFVASEAAIHRLFEAGQVATLYVDAAGQPANDPESNPNGSMYCIEGITSPDGRVLGKMAHSERQGANVAKNVPGEKDQRLFESGVAYFRG